MMKIRKGLIIAILATLCLAVTLFATVPTKSQTGAYDPWVDVNDDGSIDMADISIAIDDFMTSGTPMTKAGILYDSGWIDVSDKAGQYFDVIHNLNSADIIVDITGKTTADGAVHQRHIGGTDFVAGWNKTYGGTGQDLLQALTQTADGGYALAGYTFSFGAGGADSWLMKTDASGNEQWNKTYGGTNDDSAWDVVQTADGGYALVGCTTSFGAGLYEAWFVKTDAYGNMQWNKTYGGPNYDWIHRVIETTDGGYALACWTNSFGAGYYDFWLIKTDANGTAEWSKTYGEPDHQEAPYGVVQTGDGGYALAGYTGDALTGYYDSWLVKTDASGNQQWNKTYGGTRDESLQRFVQTTDGGYALAGSTNSFGSGNFDFWLVKTNANGNQLWNKTYGGTGDDRCYGLAKTSDGGYALAGDTNSFGAGGYDFWLVKTDASGNQQWGRNYGGIPDDNSQGGVIQTKDGGYALAGHTFSYGAGSCDAWLIKTDAAGNALDGFKYGLAWVDSTANSITLYRGTDDAYWNYVRVRVWKVKDSP
jgi:predicted secreted protein